MISKAFVLDVKLLSHSNTILNNPNTDFQIHSESVLPNSLQLKIYKDTSFHTPLLALSIFIIVNNC